MSEYASWIDNGATGAEGLGKMFGKIFTAGSNVIGNTTSNKVTQRGAGANMSVDIASGSGIAQLTDYGIPVWSTANVNKTISAADPSNPRKDIIVRYVDLAAYASNNNLGATKFIVVAGTPAGSPSDPSDVTIQAAVGSGNPWDKLARVTLPAAATSVVDAYITDLRQPIAFKGKLYGGSSNTNGHIVPNIADDTLALLAAVQTLTNKTFDTQLNTLQHQGYQEIARTTLGSNGDTITVNSIPARKYLRAVVCIIPSGAVNCVMTFNNDTTANYAQTYSSNSAASTTATGVTGIDLEVSNGAWTSFMNIDILNVQTSEKVLKVHNTNNNGSGANAPQDFVNAAKWLNTANQISRIDVFNNVAGDFAAGSEVIVYGMN